MSTYIPKRFHCSLTELNDQGMGMMHSLPEYDTLAAAKQAVLSRIPTGDRQFKYAGTVNEWDFTTGRYCRFWVFNHATRDFNDPIGISPAETEA